MARNGSGVYSKPAGSTATTGQDILASEHNTPIDDFVADANIARPVVAGGTGASSASTARANLGVPEAATDITYTPTAGNTATNAQDAIANNTSAVAGIFSTPQTISAAWGYTADVTYSDNVKALFGTGGDSWLYFDGTDFFIKALAGGVEVTLPSDGNFRIKQDNGETVAQFFSNGGCLFYHNNTARIATSTTGVTVTGAVVADSFTTPARAPVDTTSGTTADLTTIPSTTTEIKVMFSGVSVDGAGELMLQLGHAGGFEVTGYSSTASAGTGFDQEATGLIVVASGAAGLAWTGVVTLSKFDGNEWIATGELVDIVTGGNVRISGGSIALPDVLTQIRLTTTGAPDLFDGGRINIRCS